MIVKCGLLAGVASVAVWAPLVFSQTPAPPAEKGVVSGSATVILKRKPELLRIKVDVIAQGKTMKDALAALKDRREAIGGQLATLGASKESIAFGEAQINATVLQVRQQMAMMIMQARMGNRKKSAKKAAAPVVVSAKLTAEWPLKGADIDSLLLEVSQLQDSINAADLAGKKDLDKLSGDDDEVREELEGMQANFGNDAGQPQPGAMTFTLVSKIPPKDHSQALAEAFQKAKARAEETAKAAGAELGPLRGLGSQVDAGGESEDSENPTQTYNRAMQAYYRTMGMGSAGGQRSEGTNVLEALGHSLEKLPTASRSMPRLT